MDEGEVIVGGTCVIFRGMTAMALGNLGKYAKGVARHLGQVALLLALLGWNTGAGALPIQTEGGLSIGADGTADYTVPIAVPPGTAGIAPSLSLNYSSAGGDGILGIGWSLGGLPSITRCPQTIAQDGQVLGVTFTTTDRFCYGGQRLVAVSGTYGADGTTYRTEIDQFSQIISHGSQGGGPQYFAVQTKGGLTQFFGFNPNNANPGANSLVLGTGLQAARAWALDSVYDHSGNFYTVQYSAENATTGETHPISINYTGNAANSVTPHDSVKFIYGPASGSGTANSRAHPLIAHVAGTTATTSVLLTHVQSFSVNSSGSPVLVHDYQLNYQTGNTGRPQLISLDHCDGGSPQSCLPATTFGFSSATINNATTQAPSCTSGNTQGTGFGISNAQPYIVDLNNDGRDDILWVDLRTPVVPNTQITPPPPGQTARVNATSGTGPISSGNYQIWYSNGDGSFNCTSASFSNTALINTPGGLLPTFGGTPLFGDFGGTGRTDILLEGNVSTQDSFNWALAVNVDDAGAFNVIQAPIATSFDPGTGFVATQVAIGDFEGRGRSSIVAFQNNPGINTSWASWTNTGNYSFLLHSAPANGLTPGANGVNVADYVPYAADFNGDGKADILFDSVDPTTGLSTGIDRELAISNGDGSFTLHPLTLPVSVGAAVLTIGDFNGDGVTDLIFNPLSNGKTTGQLIVLLGNGDGTFTQVTAGQPASFTNGALAGYQVLPGSFSGTGLTDLLVEQEVTTGVSSGIYVIFTGNGDGTFTQAGAIPATAASFAVNGRPLIADFAGVGRDGILWDTLLNPAASPFDPDSSGHDAILLTTSTIPPDLMTSTTSGLGDLTTITYAPLSQGGAFYTKDAAGSVAYPAVAQQTAQPAVGAIHTADGIGGTRSVTYAYAGLRTDLIGRGPLGFSSVTATDQSTAITNKTSYNQSFPLIGQPSGATTTIPNNGATVTLSSTSVTYQTLAEIAGTTGVPTAAQQAATPGTPSVTFVGQSGSSVTRNDLNGTSLPTATSSTVYDCVTAGQTCFGNPTSQTVSPDPGFQTVTASVYVAPDTTNWLVGEVQSVTVTDSVPGSSLSRTGGFTYQAGTGLLASSVIEAGVSSTNAAGQVSQLQLTEQYGYDGFGNLTTDQLSPSDGAAARTTTTGWLTPSVNLNSGLQFSQFPQTVQDALGHTAQFGYDVRFGSPGVVSDINGLKTTLTYDSFGRPLTTLNPDNTGTRLAYAYCTGVPGGTVLCAAHGAYQVTATPVNNAGTVIGPATTSTYNLLGQVVQTDTIAFDGQSTSRVTTQYDTLGRTIQVTQPFLTTASTQPATLYQYDALSRVTQVTAPDGSVVTHGYSGLVQTDTLPTAIGPFGGTESFTTTRNALGQTVTVQDPLGNPTNSSYIAFGNLASVTDAAGNVVSYSYDALGRQIGIVDPDSGTRSASYFSTGEVKTTTEPGSVGSVLTTSFAYDVLGRITSRVEPDLHSSWSYDPAGALGKLASANTASGDAAGYPGGCIYSYSYDSIARLTGTSVQFGSAAPIGFTDAYVPVGQPGAGQLASVTDGVSNAVASYGYTALGYFQKLSRGTPAAPTANPVYAILSEDASQRPLHVTYGTASFTNSLASGSSASVTDSYSYDQLNQLRQAVNAATTKSFTYDQKTGNLTSKSDVGTYSYGAAGGAGPHQLQSISGTVTASYTYGTRGNILSGEDGGLYSWTSFNQPQTITKDGHTITYYYDMNHTRVAVSTQAAGTAASPTKLYLRDGATGTLAEATVNSSGAITAMLDYFSVGGTAIGLLRTPIASGVAGTPAMGYLHTDGRGSVIAVSDDTGAVDEFDSFDPWGKHRTTGGADDPQNLVTSVVAYGYIDEEQIAGVTNLMNLNARLYNSQIGRFISPDPIGLGGGKNVYAYSGNNPTTNSDRSGLQDVPNPIHFLTAPGSPNFPAFVPPPLPSFTPPPIPFIPSPTIIINEPLTDGPTLTQPITESVSAPSQQGQGGLSGGDTGNGNNNGGGGNGGGGGTSLGVCAAGCGFVGAQFEQGQAGGEFSGISGFVNAGTPNPFLAALNTLVNRFLAPGRAYANQGTLVLASGPRVGTVGTQGVSANNGQPFGINDPGTRHTALGDAFAIAQTVGFVFPVVRAANILLNGATGLLKAGSAGLAAEEAGTESITINVNKLNHIFGNAEHDLDGVVAQFGSQQSAFSAIQQATQAAVVRQGVTGIFETTVQVAGETITVRGNVINGIAKIGTAFK
jgi:RHS repeat-associated protein